MYPIGGALLAGFIIALFLMWAWKGLMWYFDIYHNIFFVTGFGVFWKRSGFAKKIFFILGLFLWLIILLMLIMSQIIWVIFLIWIGVKVLKFIF